MNDLVTARYVDGRALIEMQGRDLLVERRDDEARLGSCPLELLSTALAG